MLTFHASAMKLSTGAVTDDSNAIGDFVRIMPDGGIYFQFVKHEMGQGIATAMAQAQLEQRSSVMARAQDTVAHA